MAFFKKKIDENKFDSIYDNWFKLLKILPFFLLIWIFYQFIALLTIDKLAFFSWSQVISDSVALFFPVAFLFFWATLWLYTIHTDDKIIFAKSLSLTVLFFSVFFWLLYYLWLMVIYFTFAIWFIYSLFAKIWIFIQVISWVDKEVEKKVETSIWRKNLIWLTLILLMIILFYILETHNMNYLYVKNDQWKLEKIIFINDRYIISEKSVLPNNQYTVIKIAKDEKELNNLQEIFQPKE